MEATRAAAEAETKRLEVLRAINWLERGIPGPVVERPSVAGLSMVQRVARREVPVPPDDVMPPRKRAAPVKIARVSKSRARATAEVPLYILGPRRMNPRKDRGILDIEVPGDAPDPVQIRRIVNDVMAYRKVVVFNLFFILLTLFSGTRERERHGGHGDACGAQVQAEPHRTQPLQERL
jgi:hypothetical protein